MTTDLQEIGRILSHKHILLDNNVLTKASDHTMSFRPFVQLLESSECKPVISPFIKFEYLRGAYAEEHKKKRQAFIDLLSVDDLKSGTDKIIDLAVRIANVYAQRDLRSPSIVDCSLAAEVICYRENLFVATTNHKDFPTFLFDRVGVLAVDTDKDVIPIGIYGYSDYKAREVLLVE